MILINGDCLRTNDNGLFCAGRRHVTTDQPMRAADKFQDRVSGSGWVSANERRK